MISDIHLCDNSPASRKEGYLEEVLDLLEQTVELCHEHRALAVWAGDVFHLKTPARNSFSMVGRVMDIASQYPAGLAIVAGNHDTTHDRMENIPNQPLSMLGKLSNVELFTEPGWQRTDEIYFVPWLQRFNDQTVAKALAEYRDMSKPSLVVTHAPLYPPGKKLPYEFYDTAAWANAMGNHGAVFYGHVHNPHGIYKVEDVTFCNNGALSRGSLDESNLTRPVLATLWSSISGLFRGIPLRAQPADEIFKMEVKDKKAAQVRLDDFLASVGQASIDITTVSSVMDYIKTLNLGPSLEEAIKDLLDMCE